MGLLVTGVAALVFVLFMIGCAQKQLRPASASILEKIDKAAPAKGDCQAGQVEKDTGILALQGLLPREHSGR